MSRREVALEPRVAEQPLFHLRGLVRPAVVQDQMDLQVNHSVDVPQEADEVDAAVAALDLARRDVQGREQLLVHAAALNLGLLMRHRHGVGTLWSLQGLAAASVPTVGQAATAVSP